MSSLDVITTIQPEELWLATTLERIVAMDEPQAVALVPRLRDLLAEELEAWKEYLTDAQADSYSAILHDATQEDADIEALVIRAVNYIEVITRTRMEVLNEMCQSQSRDRVHESLNNLSDSGRLFDHTTGTYGGVPLNQAIEDPVNQIFMELERTLSAMEDERTESMEALLHTTSDRIMEHWSKEQAVDLATKMEDFGIDLKPVLRTEDDDW